MKKLGKSRQTGKVIAFPGRAQPDVSWRARFEAASPAQRYELLQQALAAPRLRIDPEDLGFAFATLGQILTRANQLDTQRDLAKLMQQKAPEVYERFEPVQELMRLQDALFAGQALPRPVDYWADLAAYVPPDLIEMVLRLLLYHDRVAERQALAQQLLGQRHLEKDLGGFACSLCFDAACETVIRAQIAGAKPDWKAFKATIKALDAEPEVANSWQEFLTLSREQLVLHMVASQREDGSALIFMAPVFGRWMLEHYGISLALSRVLLIHAEEFWQGNKAQAKLTDHIRFSRAQLQSYVDHPPHGFDNFDLVLFLWGLPYVYAWLDHMGLCTPKRHQIVRQQIAEIRPKEVDAMGPQLWQYSFVHRWPPLPDEDLRARKAEARRFEATRHEMRPLSTRPEDSFEFDESPDPSEIIRDLLARMDQGDSEAAELLVQLEPTLPPELRQLLAEALGGPEPSPAPKPAPKAKKGAQPAKSKAPSGKAPSGKAQPLPGKPQPPRYDYFFSVFAELGFTRCPACEQPTKVRRFNLLVLLDAQRQMLCLQGSHKFCPACELLLISRPALELEIRKRAPWAEIGEGEGWSPMGTIDRKERDALEAGKLPLPELYQRHYPFRAQRWFNVVPPHWCFDEAKCRICQKALAEMPKKTKKDKARK